MKVSEGRKVNWIELKFTSYFKFISVVILLWENYSIENCLNRVLIESIHFIVLIEKI